MGNFFLRGRPMTTTTILLLSEYRADELVRQALELELEADMLRDFARQNEREAATLYDQACTLREMR